MRALRDDLEDAGAHRGDRSGPREMLQCVRLALCRDALRFFAVLQDPPSLLNEVAQVGLRRHVVLPRLDRVRAAIVEGPHLPLDV